MQCLINRALFLYIDCFNNVLFLAAVETGATEAGTVDPVDEPVAAKAGIAPSVSLLV